MKKNLLTVCGLAACLTVPAMAQSIAKSGQPRGATVPAWNTDVDDFYKLAEEDGSTEDSIGFFAPGTVAYANKFTIAPGGELVTAINIVWGLDSAPSIPHTFAIWTTPGGLTNMVLASTPVTVPGGNPGEVASIDIPDVAFATGQEVYIGFLADGLGALGSFFGAWDNTAPNAGQSYIWGTASLGAFTVNNIGTALNIGEIASFGLAGDWLIRANAESDKFLSLVLVGSVPAIVAPGAPQTMNVTIDPKTEALVGTPQLCYSATGGAPFTCVNLVNTGGLNWQGTLPAFACGDEPVFYFTATGSVSGAKTLPAGAPTNTYSQIVSTGTSGSVLLQEGFNAGLPAGWTASSLWHVTSSCNTTTSCDGGTFAYFGDDATCTYLEGVASTGGLTSPSFSIPTGTSATLEFCYKYDGEGGNPYDLAAVNVNSVQVWKATQALDWTPVSIDISSFAGTNANVEFFFDTVDSLFNDTLGFQVDGVKVSGEMLVCENGCYPDCDGDSALTIDDFICFQTFFALGDPYADCDGDSALTIDDFICFQTFFAIGC